MNQRFRHFDRDPDGHLLPGLAPPARIPPLPRGTDDHYLGTLRVHDRAARGPLHLDLTVSADFTHVGIGPFDLDAPGVYALAALCVDALHAIVAFQIPTPAADQPLDAAALLGRTAHAILDELEGKRP